LQPFTAALIQPMTKKIDPVGIIKTHQLWMRTAINGGRIDIDNVGFTNQSKNSLGHVAPLFLVNLHAF
jgi:hypothetical protein